MYWGGSVGGEAKLAVVMNRTLPAVAVMEGLARGIEGLEIR